MKRWYYKLDTIYKERILQTRTTVLNNSMNLFRLFTDLLHLKFEFW